MFDSFRQEIFYISLCSQSYFTSDLFYGEILLSAICFSKYEKKI